jgi:hypothetical protein
MEVIDFLPPPGMTLRHPLPRTVEVSRTESPLRRFANVKTGAKKDANESRETIQSIHFQGLKFPPSEYRIPVNYPSSCKQTGNASCTKGLS